VDGWQALVSEWQVAAQVDNAFTDAMRAVCDEIICDIEAGYLTGIPWAEDQRLYDAALEVRRQALDITVGAASIADVRFQAMKKARLMTDAYRRFLTLEARLFPERVLRPPIDVDCRQIMGARSSR
jgi:hypothetical protein